ncbi:putative bifunctional diguanylate cyclase/phosphodiesterase [Azospirillum picis]|uniref:PAS domain S-box-containing protein/diguanylate cyclase (GGDEF)-like protein n=1 Tax=Azospirillum picis TaxID=488438 RepID=A0ABU0MTQ8_9PROT|nr:bifunctional diguanylate cyclase/phosphodiesterase [Azospirillum picis]MBP2303121.1 PAS domain S-box-containing protein/diguanylate cyclase (GGDEF)-like protein [Azospirillum picis]MDQ0536873.1 PAS domain S-box-containing protein/diguanylate cyclase (GGDEF)-like protein [Azospirillum picis]
MDLQPSDQSGGSGRDGGASLPRDPVFLASLASSLLDQGVAALVYVDRNGVCLHTDDRFAAALALAPADLIGKALAGFDHPVLSALAETIATVTRMPDVDALPLDCQSVGRDGHPAILSGTVMAHRDGGGATLGHLGVFHDTGDPDRIAQFAACRDTFVATLLDAAVDGIIVSDRTGIIRSINRACCRLFGYRDSELVGRNMTMLMPPPFSRDHDRFVDSYMKTDRAKIIGIGRETLGQRKDGTVFPIHLSVGEARTGNSVTFVGIIRDLSERLAAEKRASYLARHDPLTGVLTRTAFLEECEALFESRTDAAGGLDGGLFALFSLDVDQFSDVNEAFGFHVGDAALKAMVNRVTEVLPANTIICRIAADEFAALARVADVGHARRLADLLHDRLTASIYADRHWVRLRLSVGAAVQDDGVHTLEELNAKAKLALQAVQHDGGNAVCFYTPEMAAAATRRMMLTMHLTHAIEREELHLVYQPIVDSEGRVRSAEALLRWNHHVLGPVSPSEFIPVAEESGLIVPITDWVLTSAIAQMARWEAEGVLPDRVFLNISGQQFLRGNLTQRLEELLAQHPSLRRHLGLEITEQAAVRDLKVAVRTLGELAELGIQAAIDDFGSGYSSLSYVQQLPVAKLKIDRAFVIDVPENPKNNALVRAAVGMARGLGLVTVAEGVETAEQRDFLVSVGCDLMQGYLFGRPMAPDALAAMVRGQRVPTGS